MLGLKWYPKLGIFYVTITVIFDVCRSEKLFGMMSSEAMMT